MELNASQQDAASNGTEQNNRPTEQHRKALADDLPHVDTPEFDMRVEQAMKKVCEKYAWTAQHGGMVLRRNPLKMQPLQDYIFLRIAKAEYGFRYYDSAGRKKLWFPSFEKVLSQYYEPEYHEDDPYDGAFVIAERVEFLPGAPEITHDRDGCRVLNLWKPPPWNEGDHTEEPTVFLEHLAYILDNDGSAIEHVLNFLAHLVQRPQERIGHALLITSEAKGTSLPWVRWCAGW